MTQQTRSPISFAAYLINTKEELHHVLDSVTKKIDWAPFEKILSKVYDKPVGRKSYPALMIRSLHNSSFLFLCVFALEFNINLLHPHHQKSPCFFLQ